MKQKVDSLKNRIKTNQFESCQNNCINFKSSEFRVLRIIETENIYSFNLVIHLDTFYILQSNEQSMTFFDHEKIFCKNYKNKNFTPFYGFYLENDKITGLVYEFMSNGPLSDFILTISEKYHYLYSMLTLLRLFDGIEYLHSNSLIHRDLKPSNILIDHDFIPYINDFETIRNLKCENQFTFDFASYFMHHLNKKMGVIL